MQFTGMKFNAPNRIDASKLGNIANIPQLLQESMAGAQGLIDLFATWTHTIDGLGTAYALNSQSGLSFSDLFNLAQETALNASTAFSNAVATA